MKAMVIFDSEFGNTAKIAKAIHDGISRELKAEVSLHQVEEIHAEQIENIDILVVGSPTQGFRATSPTRNLIKSIPRNGLSGKNVAGFDTRASKEMVESNKVFSKMAAVFGYAAEPIAENLVKKGGMEVIEPAGFFVEDTEGPLSEGELERAEEWGRQIAILSNN